MSDLNEIFEAAKKEEMEKMAELEKKEMKESPIISTLAQWTLHHNQMIKEALNEVDSQEALCALLELNSLLKDTVSNNSEEKLY